MVGELVERDEEGESDVSGFESEFECLVILSDSDYSCSPTLKRLACALAWTYIHRGIKAVQYLACHCVGPPSMHGSFNI